MDTQVCTFKDVTIMYFVEIIILINVKYKLCSNLIKILMKLSCTVVLELKRSINFVGL